MMHGSSVCLPIDCTDTGVNYCYSSQYLAGSNRFLTGPSLLLHVRDEIDLSNAYSGQTSDVVGGQGVSGARVGKLISGLTQNFYLAQLCEVDECAMGL